MWPDSFVFDRYLREYLTPKIRSSKNSLKDNRLRRDMPVFKRCISCGFEVVDYQIIDGICRDCEKQTKGGK